MAIYNHCRHRNSYDCADGYCNCETCESFSLDFDTLSKKQQKTIKKILSHEDDDR